MLTQLLIIPEDGKQSKYMVKIKNKILILLLISVSFIFSSNINNVVLDLPNVKNEPDPEIKNLKFDLLSRFYERIGQFVDTVDTVFFVEGLRFGNAVIELNKAIFYCGFINCKKIIVGKNMWFIKKRIVVNGIIIEPYRKVYCNKPKEILCLSYGLIFGFMKYRNIVPKIYYNLFRDEIYNNLNEFKSDPSELYIHIRSEDIFTKKNAPSYFQPPLCFYKKIIDENNFKKIYIISNGNENPNIKKLLELYPNINFQYKNTLVHDISLFAYAVNIVTSTSSFIWTVVNFSKHVKNVWNYDILGENRPYFLLMEEHRKNISYTEYVMKPKDDYMSKINPFYASEEQLKLMVEYQCERDEFIKIDPDI